MLVFVVLLVVVCLLFVFDVVFVSGNGVVDFDFVCVDFCGEGVDGDCVDYFYFFCVDYCDGCGGGCWFY